MKKWGNTMAEPKRKFRKPSDMLEAWERYKQECNESTVVVTTFSQKDGKYITANVPHPVTITFKGFALFCGMTETNFYETYRTKNGFKSVIERMKEECELDARKKFENGTIDSRLAGLWMSNHGYTTNVEQKVESDMTLEVKIDYGEGE